MCIEAHDQPLSAINLYGQQIQPGVTQWDVDHGSGKCKGRKPQLGHNEGSGKERFLVPMNPAGRPEVSQRNRARNSFIQQHDSLSFQCLCHILRESSHAKQGIQNALSHFPMTKIRLPEVVPVRFRNVFRSSSPYLSRRSPGRGPSSSLSRRRRIWNRWNCGEWEVFATTISARPRGCAGDEVRGNNGGRILLALPEGRIDHDSHEAPAVGIAVHGPVSGDPSQEASGSTLPRSGYEIGERLSTDTEPQRLMAFYGFLEIPGHPDQFFDDLGGLNGSDSRLILGL